MAERPLGDEQLLGLLEVIRAASLLPELRPDASPVLAYGLGQVFALAEGCLQRYREEADG